MTSPRIPDERYRERLAAARAALDATGGRALLVGVGADLRWLIGYNALPLERLTMLVVTAGREPRLVVPRLERAAAQASPAVAAGMVELVSWEETDDPSALVAGTVPPDAGELLVSDTLWASFLLRLEARFPECRFGLASSVLAPLRAVKDGDEVELLRAAAQAADRVVASIAAGRLVGRAEADVAREVRERLVAEGHEAAAFAIVASGPNSASPHHEPGERRIEPAEPIVLDIGGTLHGYCSDITRTLWVTGADVSCEPDDMFRALYGVLVGAQASASQAARAGHSCESVDAAARSIIERAGYGEAFIHRTGHGIGLEGHESPYIVAGNSEPLRDGHAFSVEPGIYLEGRYGARIEDIVVCRSDGPDVLNRATRELQVVAGT